MAKKDFRPKSVSLFLAVEFVDEQKPSMSQLINAIGVSSKRFRISQRMIRKFHNHKKRNSKQWEFFRISARHLLYIYNNRETLKVHEKTWIVDYRDFFIFRYTGEVFRKDGCVVYTDKTGRKFIKDFSGKIHSPVKIIYAGGKDPRFVLTYKAMKRLTIIYKDKNKDNMKISNLEAKNNSWAEI